MTTTTYAAPTEKRGLFLTALRLDAAATPVIALGLIVGARALAEMFGLADGATLLAAGIFLLIYGASMFYYGFIHAAEIPVWYRWFTTEVDFVWALGSFALALTGAFGMNDAGRAFMFASGVVVLVMAGLKYAGLRRM